MSTPSAARIQYEIAKGVIRPHTGLTSMAMNYFFKQDDYFARSIFPICNVPLSADIYYKFGLEDLLRSNWQRKPAYGKVTPTAISEHTDTYAVEVYQQIMGIDQIRETDISRRQGPRFANSTGQLQAKALAEQASIFQDEMFASKFFRSGVWANELTGVDSTSPSTGQTIKWSNDNSDPIQFIREQKTKMKEKTGRMPNRLALGAELYDALCNHPAIKERVMPGGSTANPASVNKRVLAQLFEMENLSVLTSIHNTAKQGADANMSFIADPTAMLLAYATNTPSITEPSAGYIFQWDMLGNGQFMPIMKYLGEGGTHSEFIEGMMAFDMRKTADDLAVFCTGMV